MSGAGESFGSKRFLLMDAQMIAAVRRLGQFSQKQEKIWNYLRSFWSVSLAIEFLEIVVKSGKNTLKYQLISCKIFRL